ncbi:MAG: biopolymer transporter ExbD [Bdellovibrionales bacterium]|nr:biopolymer transporter ExbD [Bdellovibrionales bacterium]
MAAKASSNDAGAIAEINVIPLVDIILVVLIIFMVAAPLVMQPKIDINLPKASTGIDDKDKSQMKVVLGKQGELFVNNIPVSLGGLTDEAKKLFSTKPEGSALLVADKGATLEMVTELVDAIKAGGIKKVAFSIQKK